MIQRSYFRLTAAICALAIATACSQASPGGRAPEPVPAFTAAVAAAHKRVEAGDYPGADRILADFALRARGTDDAAEAGFFRALYMVDPDNRTMSMSEGVRALDIYLNSGASRYRPEAIVLKRTAQSVLALRASSQPAPRIVGRDTVFVTREAEIASLKDQLAKATAELERIKKRLANPER